MPDLVLRLFSAEFVLERDHQESSGLDSDAVYAAWQGSNGYVLFLPVSIALLLLSCPHSSPHLLSIIVCHLLLLTTFVRFPISLFFLLQ